MNFRVGVSLPPVTWTLCMALHLGQNTTRSSASKGLDSARTIVSSLVVASVMPRSDTRFNRNGIVDTDKCRSHKMRMGKITNV